MSAQLAQAYSQRPHVARHATPVASWWMLKEREASMFKMNNLTFHADETNVEWLLPLSKTDQAPFGPAHASTTHELLARFTQDLTQGRLDSPTLMSS